MIVHAEIHLQFYLYVVYKLFYMYTASHDVLNNILQESVESSVPELHQASLDIVNSNSSGQRRALCSLIYFCPSYNKGQNQIPYTGSNTTAT